MPGPTTLSPLERQMLQARSRLQQEMPDVGNIPVEPMGWLDRLIAGTKDRLSPGSRVQALAHPMSGKVSYSPRAMENQSQAEVEDTLAHELTHVRQGKEAYGAKSLLGRLGVAAKSLMEPTLPYGQRPDELEAFQTESDRQLAQGRAPGVRPTFLTPGFSE